MTNSLALYLGAAILAALLCDYFLADMAYALFLAKKLAELTEYIAFWR